MDAGAGAPSLEPPTAFYFLLVSAAVMLMPVHGAMRRNAIDFI